MCKICSSRRLGGGNTLPSGAKNVSFCICVWKDVFTKIVHISLSISVRVLIQSFKGHRHETTQYNFQWHTTLPQG